MKHRRLYPAVLVMLAIMCTPFLAMAQTDSGKLEREYDHPIEDLKQALQALHADDTVKLPTLRGFVTDSLAVGVYERPYYQFETELVSRNPDRTLLRVRARVTAWHTDNAGGSQEYRSLSSNARLESEFLDRVGSYLAKIDSDLAGRIQSLQKKLDELNSKTEVLEKRREELISQDKRLEDALHSQSEEVKHVMVLKSGTRILSRPRADSAVLATTERDDMFEIANQRPGWVGLILDGGSTGWLPANATKEVSGSADQTALSEVLKETPKPFVVTRESVTQFLGDWPSLRGQQALFLWAQPVGVSHSEAREKLLYVKQLFADRYRDAVHTDVKYVGLVVIFMGTDKSAVAAARLDDIGQWLNGRMPDSEFMKRCSLDPPEVFRMHAR
jgi:hypothetical protein